MTSMDVLRRGQFNRQPGKGIEYLISKALVDKSPASVAQFLRSTPSLCKAMIGDYLGQHEEFALAVMHAYVDSTEFSGMKFHSAIREFLEGFWLPGEAQKIDHIMEKFAERYCADNPGLFENADTAYVLAHAVIMLNTNAHNPMVCKMSKDDFIRMNTTSDAEESAPKELLEEIYDSIIKEEIKLKSDTSGLGKSGRQRSETEERGGLVSILNLALPRRDLVSDTKKESKDVIKQTQAFFRNQGVKRGVFHTAQHIELVRPMVEAVCWPLLATFSVTMEEGDNKPRVLHCTEGFKAGRHITRVLGMDTMRYAFLTSLVRFTFLHALKEMRSKNVEALRTIFSLSDSGSDNLQDTWNAVLECVSRLEYLTSTPGMASTVMQGSNQPSRDAVLNPIKELAWKPSEQVFVHSVKLNSDSVVEFFTALCGVSAEELKQTPAHVYSLQKLVEISYYNMARIGMEVCFMLPPLLGLLLDCAKQTDQAVVSISLGALVYLIEVVGHQFSDRDSNTLLKSIRDASYTTQPLELLNSLGFDGSKNQLRSARDSEVDMGGSPSLRSVRKSENHQFNNGENERLFGQAAPHIVNDSPGKHPSTSALQESEGNQGSVPYDQPDLQKTSKGILPLDCRACML